MGPGERIARIRLLDKVKDNTAYCKSLGITDTSHIRKEEIKNVDSTYSFFICSNIRKTCSK